MPGTHAPAEQRIWRHIARGAINECWPWTGCTDYGGYGCFQVATGKMERPHRFLFRLIHGEIAEGLLVCHTCDNRLCCNPDHLYAGTPRENVRDALERGGRSRCRSCGVAIDNRTEDCQTCYKRHWRRASVAA